jgi:hypothetical protein
LTKAQREEQGVVLGRLRRDATILASSFHLPLQALDAERPQVKRRYGVCDSEGNIRIRLRHARTGRLLKYSGLIDTLCHELAHLRHFNHGMRFHGFYRRLLEHARRIGIYRPEPRHRDSRTSDPPPNGPLPCRAASGPQQLNLFD